MASIHSTNGSIFSITCILLFSIIVLALSMTKILRSKTQENRSKIYQLQAYQAAKAGIEDAIYEFKQGNQWEEADLSANNWLIDYSKNDTFYKSYSTSHNGFEYPVTIYVTATNTNDTYNISSKAILNTTNPSQSYEKTISAEVIKAFTNKFYISAIQD
ncbi:MAG: hypothetical protein VW378_07970 [bacterium]